MDSSPQIRQLGYPLDSCSPVCCGRFSGLTDFGIRNGFDAYRLLSQPEEELAATSRSASVESKGELLQVVIEVLVTDRPLMGPDQPPFEQRYHKVNPGHQFGRRFLLAAKESNRMSVALLVQRLVSEPPVRVDHAAGFHRVLDEGNQTLGRGIGNRPQTNASDTPPLFLSRHHNQGFLFGLPTAHTFLQSAQVGFIYLHAAGQPIPPRPDHRPTQLMEPCPGLLVTSQPQHPLQTQGAGAIFLGGHPPHSPKPRRQGAPRILEDRSGCHRGLMTAPRTLQEHPAQGPILFTPAARTPKPIGPAQVEKILPTSLLRGKTGFELRKVPRVIFHSAAILHVVAPESRGYPDTINWNIEWKPPF